MPKPSKQEVERKAVQSARDRILRDTEVGVITGLSRTPRWRLIKAGKFPHPIKLTDHAIGWREAEVTAWIASRSRAAEQAA